LSTKKDEHDERIHMMKPSRFVAALFVWWVIVSLSPVLGPFATNSQCTHAATEYAKKHNVVATCQRDD